jgi:dihydrofolate reductase
MKLVVQQFLSLDGISQGPGSPDEDPSDGFDRGGWFVPFVDDALMGHAKAWCAQADTFLFGARTYRNFARDWPQMNDPNDPIASALNGLPKYVVSKTLDKADWAHTTVIRDDWAGAVGQLKRVAGRELQIHGSAKLAGALLSAGLVDEMRLVIAPVVLGQGRRLFDGRWNQPLGFKLVSSAATPAGLTVLVLERSGAPGFGVYGRE